MNSFFIHCLKISKYLSLEEMDLLTEGSTSKISHINESGMSMQPDLDYMSFQENHFIQGPFIFDDVESHQTGNEYDFRGVSMDTENMSKMETDIPFCCPSNITDFFLHGLHTSAVFTPKSPISITGEQDGFEELD